MKKSYNHILAIFFSCSYSLLLTGCHQNNLSTSPPDAVISAPEVIYVPATGTTNITVSNTSKSTTAQNITATNLPSHVSSTSCNAAPSGSCVITITANTAIPAVQLPITIQGSNTNALSAQLSVEALQLIVSGTVFTTPGTQTVTITNPTHSQVNIDNISLTNQSYNVALASNTCGSTLSPLANCTATLSANSNAYVPVNSSLSVSVTGTTSSSGDTVGTGTITIASPQVTLGNGTLFLEDQSGHNTPVQVTVGPGFNLQSPTFNLYQSGTQNPYSGVSINPNTCTGIVSQNSTCSITLTNTATLNPQNDGVLTLNAGNLLNTQNINVNVIGGVAINAEALSDPQYYTRIINGPKYAVVSLQNTDPTETTSINAVNITNDTGNTFNIVNRTTSGIDPFYGNYAQCATSVNSNLNQVNQLGPNATCIVVLNGVTGDPSIAPKTALLNIGTQMDNVNYNKVFNLTNTSYLYAGGDFTSLGSAISGSNKLLAKCTAGQCENFFGDMSSGANSRIDNIIVDSAGNLYLGGYFNTLGTASAGSNKLLAKCSVNTCQNILGNNTSGADDEIQTMAIDSNQNLYVGGQFSNLGAATAGSNKLLAKCTDNSCINFFQDNTSGANASINSIAIDGNNTVYVGGFFIQLGNAIAGSDLLAQCTGNSCTNYFGNNTSGASGTITTLLTSGADVYATGQFSNLNNATAGSNNILAQCTNGNCQNYFGDSTSGANSYIFNMAADDNGNIYVGGDLSNLGSATSGSNKLLAKCTNNICQNYFGDNTSGANSPVDVMATDASGNIYAGGYFTSLGTASAGGKYLLAQCHNNTCQNFFAQGSDGADSGTFALAIGNQITVIPQP